jgi:hypothetical protein
MCYTYTQYNIFKRKITIADMPTVETVMTIILVMVAVIAVISTVLIALAAFIVDCCET